MPEEKVNSARERNCVIAAQRRLKRKNNNNTSADTILILVTFPVVQFTDGFSEHGECAVLTTSIVDL